MRSRQRSSALRRLATRCPDCGRQGRYRDTVTRPLKDLLVAGYPLVLRVAVPRYRCDTVECGRAVFNQDLGKLAYPRSSTTCRCARYVLRRLMIDRTTISAIAAELGVSWHTVSSVAMRATAELVAAAGPDRLASDRRRRTPLGTSTSRARRVRHAHHRSHAHPRSDWCASRHLLRRIPRQSLSNPLRAD
jgi:hypothetical protein